MLRDSTPSAAATVGTAVFRIVVSSDSMRNATATIQGSRRLAESSGKGAEGGVRGNQRAALEASGSCQPPGGATVRSSPGGPHVPGSYS